MSGVKRCPELPALTLQILISANCFAHCLSRARAEGEFYHLEL